MSRKAAVVAALRAGGGMLQTRLRERSTGDVHDMPSGLLALPGTALGAIDVVSALEELATHGVVVSSLAVHPFDSAEYCVSWVYRPGVPACVCGK